MPDHVIDYVLEQQPSKTNYNVILWGGLTLMFFGVGGAMALVSFTGENMLDANALARAHEEAALFYQHNFGFSGVLVLFAGIFLFGAFWLRIAAHTARRRASQFVYGLMNKKTRHKLPKPEKMAALATISDPEAYMAKLMPNPVSLFAWIGVALTALTIAAFERDVSAYEIMTPTHHIATPWIPWDDETQFAWADATQVALGCGRFSGGRGSPTYEIVYVVAFPSGHRVSLDEAIPLKGSWLNTITVLDKTLVDGGAQFKRWSGDPPLHPKCLERLARRYKGHDLNRVHKLLRLREFD